MKSAPTKCEVVLGIGLMVLMHTSNTALAQHFGCGDCATHDCGEETCTWSQECCDPLWTATADAIFLNRSEPGPLGLLFDASTNVEVFNAQDFDFDTQVGPRVQLMRRVDSNRAVSIEYFGIDKWEAEASIGPGDYSFAADGGGGPDVTNLDLNYETELHNAEFSFWGAMDRRIQFFGGFRWVRLDDDLRFDGVLGPFDGDAPFTGSYLANNNLYGFQAGCNGVLLDWWRFQLSGIAKAGIFYNDVDSQFLAQSTSFGQFAANDARDQTAFVGELGLNLTFRVTSHIALRGGYQVLWLSGVAVAPDQIPSTSADVGTTTVDATSSVFFHGANAGLEFTW